MYDAWGKKLTCIIRDNELRNETTNKSDISP